MIKTIQEIAREHMLAGVETAMTKYRGAIHPLYLVDRNGRPAHCGTCFGLDAKGRKYLVSAAHVVDGILQNGGYVTGTNKLEALEGDFYLTAPPNGDRDGDRYDFAWKHLSDSELQTLGWTEFIQESDLCANQMSPVGRTYLAVGFPRSKNKKADPTTRIIRPKIQRYTAIGKEKPELFESLGLNGEQHIAIQYEDRALDANGVEVNSVYPRGMSGGPMFDLGKVAVADLSRSEPYDGRLAGIIIEKDESDKVLIAVKIDFLFQCIASPPPTSTSFSVPLAPPVEDEF